MTTDKTGAPTSVSAAADQFTIAVDGQQVGLAAFVDHDDQRIFHHTEVDDSYEGRGLATILVSEALQATRDAGKRIVAVCPTGGELPRQASRLRRHRRSGHRRHRAVPPRGRTYRLSPRSAAIVRPRGGTRPGRSHPTGLLRSRR